MRGGMEYNHTYTPTTSCETRLLSHALLDILQQALVDQEITSEYPGSLLNSLAFEVA